MRTAPSGRSATAATISSGAGVASTASAPATALASPGSREIARACPRPSTCAASSAACSTSAGSAIGRPPRASRIAHTSAGMPPDRVWSTDTAAAGTSAPVASRASSATALGVSGSSRNVCVALSVASSSRTSGSLGMSPSRTPSSIASGALPARRAVYVSWVNDATSANCTSSTITTVGRRPTAPSRASRPPGWAPSAPSSWSMTSPSSEVSSELARSRGDPQRPLPGALGRLGQQARAPGARVPAHEQRAATTQCGLVQVLGQCAEGVLTLEEPHEPKCSRPARGPTTTEP